MTFPQGVAWGHLGIRNPAQFALMNAATYAGQVVLVDDGTQLLEYRSDGAAWTQSLTTSEAATVRSLVEASAYSDASRIMPLRNGILAPAIQFQGAADTTASLGTLGIVVNAANNSAAGALLAAGSPLDYTSTINGSSPAGTWTRLQFTSIVTSVHMAQVLMGGTYVVKTSGACSAATYDMARLDFDSGDAVYTLLVYEGPPTNFAGAAGTGSARQVVVLGISSVA